VIITLVFKKNANFFAENWEKSKKIVIITSIPGTYLVRVLDEVGQGQVVDDIPGADQERSAVCPQKLEVILVRLVSQELVGRSCGKE
jgi:hypothetical protein